MDQKRTISDRGSAGEGARAEGDRMSAPQHALSQEARDILLHCLGWNYTPRRDRNYYCASLGNEEDMRAINELVGAGLFEARRKINEGADQYFSATPAGQALAPQLLPPRKRLTRSQIRYERYREVADLMTFREFLAYEAAEARGRL